MGDRKLHDYQIVGRDFLRGRPQAGLFMDMGLGKTATALSALEPRHLPVLVIAPKRVAEEVWDVEVEDWRPDLTVSVAMGEPDERATRLRAGADITVISQDNFRDVAKVWPKGPPFKTIIVDELSGYKTRASVRWKTARKLRRARAVENFWGLTGTPAPNGYMNLWAQLALLDDGERLGKGITGYREAYFRAGRQLPNGVVTEWLLLPGAKELIKGKIEDICLSMETDGRIDLPPVTINEVDVRLPENVMKVYKKLKNDLVVDLHDIFGGEIHSADTAAALTNRLAQIAAGFIFVDEAALNQHRYTSLHREKIKAAREIVDGTGSPVLIFYRYRPEREMLLEEFGDQAHTVDEPGVFKAWNRGEIPILVCHPGSVGHGLNLQHGGHTIIWTSMPNFDLEVWQQANKRLARQGQKQPVIIHVLMARGTVDKPQLSTLEAKEYVQDDLLEHLESPI